LNKDGSFKPPIFLTWVGSKSKISKDICLTIPTTVTNYYEPFLGSGSVLFHVLFEKNRGNIIINKNLYASDSNKSLIELYKNVQQRPTELYKVFTEHFVLPFLSFSDEKKVEFYYKIRLDFNMCLHKEDLFQSARFLFLNKTCFGGLFRTNLKGFFNVPYGFRKKPNFPLHDSLLSASKLIKDVHFYHQIFNFNQTFEKGDFFYLDPPYMKVKKTSFVSYSSSGFSNDDFFKLIEFCTQLNNSGGFFSMSNSTNLKVLKSLSFSNYFNIILLTRLMGVC
jgi:DNA adenine methylase